MAITRKTANALLLLRTSPRVLIISMYPMKNSTNIHEKKASLEMVWTAAGYTGTSDKNSKEAISPLDPILRRRAA